MSLSAILDIAISGVNASQAALKTISENVTNVNTPGYARQITSLQSQVLGDHGGGVQVAEITRIVDDFLNAELHAATSDAEAFDARASLHDRIQTLLGRPDDESTLPAQINLVFKSFTTLVNKPQSPSARLTLLSDIEAFANSLSRLAQQAQSLRAEADRQVERDIVEINAVLKRVHDLNGVIMRESVMGRQPNALINQRAQALNEIAKIIDIRLDDLGNEGLGISTSSGLTLLDLAPRQLVYTSPGTVTSATRFPEITVNRVNPTTGAVDPVGQALLPSLRSGSLSGFLDMRDVQLPYFATQLGELAAKFVDQINAIHNDNTAVPPPNSLTGRNTGLTGVDNLSFSGTVRLAVLDPNNNVLDFVDVNLGASATIDDLVAAVNGSLTGGALNFAGGVLTFGATNSANGIAILQDAASPTDRAGRGFAHFFGLNDLMEARAAPHYDTGLTGAEEHRFSGTIAFDLFRPDGTVLAQHSLDFGALPANSTFTDVLNNLNANLGGFATFSLDAKGMLVMTPQPAFPTIKVAVTSDSSNRAVTGVTFSQLFGVGDSYRIDAALDIAVKSAIRANSNLLALAKLDTAAAAGNGIPGVSVGDSRGALEFQNLGQRTIQFAAAGDLGPASANIVDYTGLVISQVSVNANNFDRLSDDAGALKRAIEQRVAAVSGVNIDEELANLIVFQNAFTASARLVATSEEMFETLLDIIR